MSIPLPFDSFINQKRSEIPKFIEEIPVSFEVLTSPSRYIHTIVGTDDRVVGMRYYIDGDIKYKKELPLLQRQYPSRSEFDPIIGMTQDKAFEFCASHNLKPFIVQIEYKPYKSQNKPTKYKNKDMNNVPDRAEIKLHHYSDTTLYVCGATIYRDGKRLTEVSHDECEMCGGLCDNGPCTGVCIECVEHYMDPEFIQECIQENAEKK